MTCRSYGLHYKDVKVLSVDRVSINRHQRCLPSSPAESAGDSHGAESLRGQQGVRVWDGRIILGIGLYLFEDWDTSSYLSFLFTVPEEYHNHVHAQIQVVSHVTSGWKNFYFLIGSINYHSIYSFFFFK